MPGYKAAYILLTSRCVSTLQAHSQNRLDRGQEEEETIEQARTQLERLRKQEGGRSPSNPSSDEEPTQKINDTNNESLEDTWLKSEIGEEVEEDSETDVREGTKNPPLTGGTRPQEVPEPEGCRETSCPAQTHGVADDIQSRSTEAPKTCRSPTTGLLRLQASSASAPITLVTRHSLARILGPALVIMNTAGRGDKLLLGLQLAEEQHLEQILEKAAKKLPDVTICRLPTPAADPFA